ncbi:Autophagy-related protein 13 [Musa troglodytarum]|uniref:Autophagy-related protein 13 n=1 Tax=Musa troglodytarum TaxID=320322 RepID=A0A9E7G7U4_9LILI|nr:Autophagy-related protein 13 [Musa troglodytarum]
MATSPSHSSPESAIIEQVITEFFAKSLHIILESRSPYVSSRNYSVDQFMSSPSSSCSSSSSMPRDKWFNLALRDCPAALENFDIWRKSNLDPLVIDIVLIRRPLVPDVARPLGGCLLRNFSGNRDLALEPKSWKIVERWIVQYERHKSSSSKNHKEIRKCGTKNNGGSSCSSETAFYKKTYERYIILFRSLYVLIRLLPMYKLFRELNSSGQICPLSLSHRISSSIQPFTQEDEAKMNQFTFVPIDTPRGRLSLSVQYLRTLEDIRSEPSAPLSLQFILDYVGSPTTDPFRRLKSLPSARSSPPLVSFTRQHSWSNDHGALASVSHCPSVACSEARGIRCNPSLCLPPLTHHNDHSPPVISESQNAAVTHKNNMSFDEFWPSPFSPTSSPSSPAHLPGQRSPNALQSGSSQIDIAKACPNTASQTQAYSSEGKQQIKMDTLRCGNYRTGLTLVKHHRGFPSGKDDTEKLAELPSSSTQRPRSKSSSGLSLSDKFDDCGFACPFADYKDVTGSCNRRSPDAVIGAVVRMLTTAAPLRQGLSDLCRPSQVFMDESLNPCVQHDQDNTEQSECRASTSEILASVLLKSKTAAEGLEELRRYKEMKESILKRGASWSSDVDSGPKVCRQ